MGYGTANFVSTLPPSCICSICDVLKDAKSLNCGHTFCSGCIQSCLSNNHRKCPNCRTVVTGYTHNYALRDIINALQIRCFQCSWTGRLDNLVEHGKTCPFKSITCKHCKQLYLRKDMDDHLLEHIKHLQIKLDLTKLDLDSTKQELSKCQNDTQSAKEENSKIQKMYFNSTKRVVKLAADVKDLTNRLNDSMKSSNTITTLSRDNQYYICDRPGKQLTINEETVIVREGDVIEQICNKIKVLSMIFDCSKESKLTVIDIYNEKIDDRNTNTLQRIRDARHLPSYDIPLSQVKGLSSDVPGKDQICHVCGNDDDSSNQILCSSCSSAFHQNCLPTCAKRNVNSDEWQCPFCDCTIPCTKEFLECKSHNDYGNMFDMVQKKLVGNNPEKPDHHWQLCDLGMLKFFPPALLRARFAVLEHLEGNAGVVTMASSFNDNKSDRDKKKSNIKKKPVAKAGNKDGKASTDKKRKIDGE